jgi:hypothetical protein
MALASRLVLYQLAPAVSSLNKLHHIAIYYVLPVTSKFHLLFSFYVAFKFGILTRGVNGLDNIQFYS